MDNAKKEILKRNIDMKDAINKKLIAIVGTACGCVIAITGALVAVNNSINEEKEVAVVESQQLDDSKDAEMENTSIISDDVADLIPKSDEDKEDEGTPDKGSNIEDFGENAVVKCTRQIVTDPQTNVAVMSVLVPDGWSASCYVDWSTYCNEKIPGRAFVELRSPNGDIDIQYVSSMFFVQDSMDTYVGNYHKNVQDLLTELDYMNAQEYTQHMLGMSQISMKTSTEEYVDSDRQNKIKNMAYDEGVKRRDFIEQIFGPSYRSLGAFSVDLTDYDGRTYIQHGISDINGMEGYTETICEEFMYEITATTTIGAELVGYFSGNQITKYWEPYLFSIACFSDEQTYNDNRDLYRFLISNMILCKDFLYLNSILGSQYVEMATKYTIEITNYAHDVMMQYQQETMQQEDAWVQNFSDYIYDQTTYTMSDGYDVTVPTSADYVYSDGNDVIWSNTAFYDPGPGYEQIN